MCIVRMGLALASELSYQPQHGTRASTDMPARTARAAKRVGVRRARKGARHHF